MRGSPPAPIRRAWPFVMVMRSMSVFRLRLSPSRSLSTLKAKDIPRTSCRLTIREHLTPNFGIEVRINLDRKRIGTESDHPQRLVDTRPRRLSAS